MADGDRGDGIQRNVFGAPIDLCSNNPKTGFYRSGCCHTGPDDHGVHTACVVLTDEFLEFSKACGNDLSTPRPEYSFAGLKAGQRWCLCAARWKQALDAGKAPRLVLNATHEVMLQFAPLEVLMQYGVDVQ